MTRPHRLVTAIIALSRVHLTNGSAWLDAEQAPTQASRAIASAKISRPSCLHDTAVGPYGIRVQARNGSPYD